MTIQNALLAELNDPYTDVVMEKLGECYFEYVHLYDYLDWPKQLVVTYEKSIGMINHFYSLHSISG